jgi:Peptidase family M23
MPGQPHCDIERMLRLSSFRIVLPLLAIALVSGGITAVGVDAGPLRLAAAPAAYVAPTLAHPFSDPVWFPLRTPVRVSCVKTNCSGPYHSYWAMDLTGNLGDPIYAAGAGVFHVGAIDPGCRASVNDAGGSWVWVDHGAGKVSRYHHVNAVVAKEGQLVTPATVIARMGHSGDVSPCTTNYLHFEVRVNGVKGVRVDPGTLLACQGTTRVSWPSAWGKTSWDALTARSIVTPRTTSSCVATPWASTPATPSPVTGTRASGRATVRWPAPPSGTNRTVVAMQTYHPSVPEWGVPTYQTLPSTTRASTYTGLQNGRQYRWTVTFHNASGNSAWSRNVTLTPAAAPTTPRTPRWLTATTSKIRYAWWSSTARGTPVTSYTVSRRLKTSTGYGVWVQTKVSSKVLNYNWLSVARGRTYQVTVKANSAVGSSPVATIRNVTVPR